MSRWPLMVRGMVIAVCGILLGIGGCLGFLAAMDTMGALAFIGGAAFFSGLVALAVGIIIVVIGVFKWFFGVIVPRTK